MPTKRLDDHSPLSPLKISSIFFILGLCIF